MIWIRIPAVWMLALLPTLALGCAPQPPTESDGSAEASGREAGAIAGLDVEYWEDDGIPEYQRAKTSLESAGSFVEKG